MIPKLTKEQFRHVYDQGFDATYALFDALQQAIETLEKRVAYLEWDKCLCSIWQGH